MKFTFCFILLQIVVKANADVDHSVCSGIINGRIPHPDPQNCGLYIFCMMTFANVRSCPPNTVFVPHFNSSYREGECEPGNAETCEVWTTTTIPETSTAIYTTTELDDPTLTTENEYDTTIPDATTDLPTNESTTTEKPLTTTSRLPTTTPIHVHRCPPSGYGYIPHHTNCNRYFECIRGVRHLRFCYEGFLFDSVTLKCTYPELAICAGVK
ncbi:hypothetical protein ACKWTF_016072 [Chironomus riparius]